MVEKNKKEEPIEFSFKDVEKDVDEALEKKDKETKEKPEEKISHISDKIKQGMEIKENLPDKGFLEFKAEEIKIINKDGTEREALLTTTKDVNGVDHIEITNGQYVIDLRNDAEFWFIRSPTVVPQIIQQGIRAAIDRRKSYEPEKRRREIPVWLIAGIAVGAIVIIIMLISLFS
jgi:hypothetical protein